jgi:hypothetical protein
MLIYLSIPLCLLYIYSTKRSVILYIMNIMVLIATCYLHNQNYEIALYYECINIVVILLLTFIERFTRSQLSALVENHIICMILYHVILHLTSTSYITRSINAIKASIKMAFIVGRWWIIM